MTRQVIIVLDDEGATTSERYLDLLFEELAEVLLKKNLKLVKLEETLQKEQPDS